MNSKPRSGGEPPSRLLIEEPAIEDKPVAPHNLFTLYPCAWFTQLSARFKEVHYAEHTALSIELLAALQALLYRYASSEELSAAFYLASSSEPLNIEDEWSPPDEANLVTVPYSLTENQTVQEVLERVYKSVLDVYAPQDLPDAFRHSESTGPWKLQIAFELPPAFFNLEKQSNKKDLHIHSFDLFLQLECKQNDINCSLIYNSAFLDTSTIARFAGHLRTLLEDMPVNRTRRIDALPLLTSDEYRQIVVEWNATERDYPYEQCLHQLIEAQVVRTPDAPALIFAGESLTYRELNVRANQLAHYLQRQGVGPDVMVSVVMERSFEMVIALLGILKAGGAYVPLDPALPPERLAFMLADLGAGAGEQTALLLTQPGWLADLPEHHARVLCLFPYPQMDRSMSMTEAASHQGKETSRFRNGQVEIRWEEIALEASENPVCQTTPDNLAYVIYTSGSTGKPKGAMNTHRGICNRLLWMQDAYQLTAADCVMQKTPFSFDVSVWEFFWPLLAGARLAIAQPGGHKDSAYLVALIQEQRVTTLHFVPSMLQVFLEEPELEACSSLRQVICSGEALLYTLQERFFARHSAALHNLYGPTEAAIDVTYWPCQRQSKQNIVPIGYPIANTQMYILDRSGQPVPAGVQGELFIGGVGVARGYHNRPELTAERFIDDPFSSRPGAQLYRTGDLARYLPDRAIEYLGRIDQQIKLRGFRIELGEIEAVLTRHPAVREAAVIVSTYTAGEQRLVAYIVFHKEQQASTRALSEHMARQVPDYMIPSVFLVLDALPLNSSGKVDRRALPAPAEARRELSEQFVAPRNALEASLATIWEQVLDIKQVGVTDNFFALGGHSLLAMRITTYLRTTYQIELSLRDFFDMPTISQLAERLAEQKSVVDAPTVAGLSVLPRSFQPLDSSDAREVAILPTSFAQQRLWFLDQMTPQNTAYNIPATIQIKTALDTAALRLSLQTIVDRHEVLRTVFALLDGEPVQLVMRAMSVDLHEINLLDLPEDARNSTAQRLVAEAAARPFDLARGPLLRVALLHLGEEEYMLALVIHHIVADGWSMGVFFQELVALYTAFVQGQAQPLPDLPVQYADFAAWQRSLVRGELQTEQLVYWTHQLADAPAVLELPADRSRPAIPTLGGATYSFRLSEALTDALKRFSRQEGVTLYITLVAAFQTLLHRYTGQDDLVIGTAIADRKLPEVENLLGMFLNTLALRTSFADNPDVHTLLQRVREVMLDAYAHQDVPFEQLVNELQLERVPGQSPLFQVSLMLDPPSPSLETAWTLTRMATGTGGSKFDLSLELDEQPDGLVGHLEYSTDLFNEATIARLAEHWQVVLTGMLADPSQAVGELPLLTETEREQILITWNATQSAYPGELCLHQLFATLAERVPEAMAVTFEKTSLTYRQLNERANQLAHHLQTLGVGPDRLVAICVERSLEMLIGLLGILKAGGAYVPLDPTYPADRVAFMLEDASVDVLVTQQSLLAQLPPHQARVVCLDADEEDFAHLSVDNPLTPVASEHLCYVIYTSGSTGKPKGVQIPHRAVVNFLLSMQKEPGLTAEDTLLAVTTLSFDIAGLELYLPLLSGAHLVIASRDTATSGAALGAMLEQTDTTVMQATPITWRILLSSGWQGKANLKALCGGEALPLELARELLPHVAALYNMYGPTETTIWSTLNKIELIEGPISIGRPIANTCLAILDKHFQPVPVGVPGELYIGGDGLARGYLKRPELTEERFLWLKYVTSEKARLYRTGDVARYRSDGTVELIGRVDHQVKLRGFRIELGEIETVLEQHFAVRQAIVIVREDTVGDKRLVAYIQPEELSPLVVGELRQHAQGHLPYYMVPSALVVLERLPQTPNGKVDRRALPAPEQDQLEVAGTFQAPRNALEEVVAGVWSQVLGVPQVGVHDNFFALGGHSLIALQVTSRLRTALHVELTLRNFFEAPTVALLAALIVRQRASGMTVEEMALQSRPRSAGLAQELSLPASSGQQGLWFLHQVDTGSAEYNIFATVRLHRSLDLSALEKSLDVLMERHEALRTTFTLRDGQLLQIVAAHLHLPLRRKDLRDLEASQREQEALRLANEEFQRAFDLAQGPLVRALVVHLAEQEQVLLLSMHHSISDGWSLGLLLQELSSVYEAQVSGSVASLAEVSVQFGDVAVWQQEERQGASFAEHLAYWKSTLAGAPTVLELPADRVRSLHPSRQGAQHTFRLSQDLTEALKVLSQQENATLYMTLVAAFQAVLQRYTGQEDLLLGTTTAGRARAGVERTVGYFTNTLVLRADLSGHPTVRELLGRVRETVLNVQLHQEVPFDVLIKEVQPERAPGQSPLFQVFLTMDAPLPALAADWDTEQLDLETGAAKFDLSLDFAERAGGLVSHWEYSTELFDASTIERLANHWQTLLRAMVADPGQPLAEIALLSETERQQVLVTWNETQAGYPGEQSIHQVFAEQVARTPEAIAATFVDVSWTYRELNGRANQLAHYLQRQGFQPGERAGIYIERSLEMLVGLLGILKAGGVYVPLDPSYPVERLAFMLADAQLAALVTRQELTEKVTGAIPNLICLDRDWPVIAQESQDNPASGVGGADCAYMIYTSGSTGKPKGVLGTHRASLNRFQWMWQTYPFAADEVCCQKTTLSFVDAIWEIFGPLLQGVRQVLIPDLVGKDPVQLVRELAAARVTRLVLVPSLLRVLLESYEDLQAQLPSLRHWICSGEALPMDLVRLFAQRMPQARLLNLYGSSEVAADATCYEVEPGRELVRVPIGRPIANTRVYVLDQWMQPVPIGVAGELHIGGEGLARGYFNRPELTQVKFVEDPFGSGPESRLYKTGDQARYLADGTLEYLGRLDQQVKLRGMRLELGEIETVLVQHPTVSEAVAAIREDVPGDQRLVAYVVRQSGQEVSAGELRQELEQQLPGYMVPGLIVFLAALPLTPNGKVNRRALPVPEQDQLEVAGTFQAPRNALEEVVAGVWSQVLGVPQVGVHDNFFALGGHSLIALQVTSRLRTALHVELTLRNFFEAPTVALLAALIVRQRASGMTVEEMALQSRPRSAGLAQELSLPASSGQQGLWFLHQVDTGSAEYNIFATVRLHRSLDLSALEKSLDVLMERHEALRTTFALRGGQLLQIVAAHLHLPLRRKDLRDLEASQREQEALRLANEEFQRAFDLARGPLMRALVVHLAEQEQVLLLSMHHSISDGWSLGLLLQELSSVYEAQVSGSVASLAEVSVQFGDVAVWQEEERQGASFAEHLAYWKSTLAGAPTVLELPADRVRPLHPSRQGAQHTLFFSPALTEALKALSRQENVTLYMTLVAAFQAVLQRYTGQEDLLLGTTTAGRARAGVERTVGYFTNTLVLRADLSGHPTVRELLGRVREMVLNAQLHQEVPFDVLIKEVQPERAPGQSPLFQVFLTMDAPFPPLPTGWDTEQLDLEAGAAKFDLSLDFAERAGGLVSHWEYSTELFDASTIERLANHWQTLLRAMVADPGQPLAEIALLSETERQRMLVTWNETQAGYPGEQSIHQVFAEQVARTPEAIAATFVGMSWTYRELNGRANQLAHYLQRQGFQPGERVGIYIERSLEILVGLLGILKAGGVYVPLDPSYPVERLAFMLADAQLAALVTRQELTEKVTGAIPNLICLDRDWPVIAQESQDNPASGVGGADCAYMIYTSGSTGKPKGVLGTHRASLNRFQWMWQTYPFAADEVCCQKTTLSFVDAIWEIFGPLLQGVRQVLIPDLVGKDPVQLVRELAAARVTRLVLVPSLLRVLLESYEDLQAQLPSLRHWICSGEALPMDLVRLFAQRMPQARLLNLYGSSEVAADATCYEVEPGRELVRVPIGRPIANTRVYVLDQWMQPVPIGVAGELHIGGEGLARGYFNRPELTQVKFVEDPFGSGPESRLYKTGDQARYLADGTLEYLGRLDQQVKLRGMRLELGEIETVLVQHPAVSEAVAAIREDVPGDQRLVAYVVRQSGQEVSAGELRQELEQQLPGYMVPGLIVFLAALPLTPNGKVNRRALPSPDYQDNIVERTYVAPYLTTHYQLIQIWEELLPVRPIGIQDNFFTLGGHSLLAARLVARIAEVCGKTLPLSVLFQSATIEGLTTILLAETKAQQTRTVITTVQASGSQQPFFFLHGDWNGKAFYCLKLSRELGSERPFYLLEPYLYDSLQVLPSIEEVAAAHIDAMRRIQPQGPYLFGGWCNGAMVAYEMAQQLRAAGQEVDLLVLMDAGVSSTFSNFLRRVIGWSNVLLRLKREQQDTLFFRLLHIYEYVRLWNYRKRLLAEAKYERPPEEVEIAHPNFASLFPSAEDLRDNYMAIFNWLASGYRVRPYEGKTAAFWAEEDNPGRRHEWEKLLARQKNVQTYFVPGNHMTSRTRHIDELARQLAECIEQA